MYLVPPMADEPPPGFVAFVGAHRDGLRSEAYRLVGGDAEGAHLYLDVLADVAAHWRRLCWWRRLTRHDAPVVYLRRRLATRTRRWREEQFFEVDVRVLGPAPGAAPGGVAADGSLALRKAAVLPGAERGGVGTVADAGIAWVHAYRRHQWRRLGRLVAAVLLLLISMIRFLSWLNAGP